MLPMRPIALACALLAALALPAAADLPSPPNSTVPARLVLCPRGDVTFRVVVRGFTGDPFVNSTVGLSFCDASGWAFCAEGQPADIFFFSPCQPLSSTGMDGGVNFALRAGGGTGGAVVKVYADGVLLGSRVLTSPDQNGDLVVNAIDQAIFATKLGTADASADFDGDGTVTAADQAILTAHLGHLCDAPTAATPRTWGAVKTIYR